MKKLVFVKSKNLKEEPYTTSKVISEYGGQEHRAVRQLIESYKKDLKEFGRVTFEMTPLETSGGIQNIKIYKLNEEQATFLITLMRNTEQVVKFKKDLVKEFFVMKEELNRRRAEKEIESEARKDLTDQIKAILGNNNVKFIKYTQLTYKVLFNKTADQLRKEYGVKKKESPKNFMDAKSIRKIQQVEHMILTMLEIGFDYHKIKDVLSNKFNKDIAA